MELAPNPWPWKGARPSGRSTTRSASSVASARRRSTESSLRKMGSHIAQRILRSDLLKYCFKYTCTVYSFHINQRILRSDHLSYCFMYKDIEVRSFLSCIFLNKHNFNLRIICFKTIFFYNLWFYMISTLGLRIESKNCCYIAVLRLNQNYFKDFWRRNVQKGPHITEMCFRI